MYVLEQSLPRLTEIPGIAHATWAGAADGLQQLSVWRQRLAPGAATPPHRHDCDEFVLCLGGSGRVEVGEQQLDFDASRFLLLPAGQTHQIFSTGPEPLELLAVFGQTPVPTLAPTGETLALPWRS